MERAILLESPSLSLANSSSWHSSCCYLPLQDFVLRKIVNYLNKFEIIDLTFTFLNSFKFRASTGKIVPPWCCHLFTTMRVS